MARFSVKKGGFNIPREKATQQKCFGRCGRMTSRPSGTCGWCMRKMDRADEHSDYLMQADDDRRRDAAAEVEHHEHHDHDRYGNPVKDTIVSREDSALRKAAIDAASRVGGGKFSVGRWASAMEAMRFPVDRRVKERDAKGAEYAIAFYDMNVADHVDKKRQGNPVKKSLRPHSSRTL